MSESESESESRLDLVKVEAKGVEGEGRRSMVAWMLALHILQPHSPSLLHSLGAGAFNGVLKTGIAGMKKKTEDRRRRRRRRSKRQSRAVFQCMRKSLSVHICIMYVYIHTLYIHTYIHTYTEA